MPRFAILCHDHPFVHWDVLLEDGLACRTWRLLASPELNATSWPAEQLADHRLFYLDYEGRVSGDRGVVSQWDNGVFEWTSCSSTCCEFVLSGAKWQGAYRFVLADDRSWVCERVSD